MSNISRDNIEHHALANSHVLGGKSQYFFQIFVKVKSFRSFYCNFSLNYVVENGKVKRVTITNDVCTSVFVYLHFSAFFNRAVSLALNGHLDN